MLREQPDVNDNTSTMGEPAAAEIRAQLERILGSRCFEQASRSSKFLRFVAEQALTGQGDRLKGYTIAVEVFGRPADFDAQNDPLVRVEAGRLRRRLLEYYAGEGKDDRLRVDLPRGNYSPVWTRVLVAEPSPAASSPPVRTPPDTKRRRRRLRALLLAVLLVVISALLVVQQLRTPTPDRDSSPSAQGRPGDDRPPIIVRSLEDLSSAKDLRGLAEALTQETLLRLDRPELFVIATDPVAGRGSGAAYVLSGSVRDTADAVRITARLVIASTGRQIWSAAFDEPVSIASSLAEQQNVARRLAAVADPYGPIFDAELERVSKLPDADLVARDCMIKYYEYRRNNDPALHGPAQSCFERVTNKASAPASAWAGLALMLLDRYAFGYGAQRNEGTAALDRAQEAARTAMDIDGDDVLANLTLARVQYFRGQDFRGAAERTLALRPDRADSLATVGGMYVLSGDPERGVPMLDRAIELTPKPAGGFYALRALADLQAERFDAATSAALKIDSPNWPLGHLIAAVAAALAGRADVAERERARLLALDPKGEAALADVLERWRVEPVLRERVERGMAIAAAPPR